MVCLVSLSLICLFLANFVESAPEEDRVVNLPGLDPQPTFKHYSGYLKASGTRKLHYWFVESQRNASTDPVLLWMNGGPGCSSLGGLLTLHGPFRTQPDGKTLESNNFAWNKVASIIYLEAPAGVGFSYSDDKDYATNDDETADNNHMALRDFFVKFPEYANNDFYVTGESYGGIYVPTLAVRVMKDKTINFKGMAIGNGCVDFTVLQNEVYKFYYYRGIFNSTLWNSMLAECCVNQNVSDCQFSFPRTDGCLDAVFDALSAVSRANLNIYNIYANCENSTLPSGSYPAPVFFQKLAKKYSGRAGIDDIVEAMIPCINSTAITTYLRQPDVRLALHIPNHIPPWESCSAEVGSQYDTQYETTKELFLEILDKKLYRTMVYQGDLDVACNFLGITKFTENLNQEVIEGHKPWNHMAMDGTSQVAGFVTQYRNLINMNMKGAGHFVPADNPIAALEMIRKFLEAEPF